MTVLAREIERVHWRLDPPVQSARSVWTEREGVIVRLYEAGRIRGEGEASPLPGYSIDTLESCERALADVDLRGDDHDPIVSRIPRSLPAARFALETALSERGGSEASRDPCWLLRSSDGRRLIAEARGAVGAGHRSLKLKIGLSFDRELSLLRRLRADLPRTIALRADANGSPLIGRSELDQLAELDLDLLEEPCPLDRLLALDRCPVPMALDESLMRDDARALIQELARRRWLRAVVLKPTALGGVRACMELAAFARSLGVEPLPSHMFEGPIARRAIARFAKELHRAR
jgi:o-succinylbenzoate synthase